jgi:hypothetical protein
MDMVNAALWGRFSSSSERRRADSVIGNDAGYAPGLRLPHAYSARAERADRKWSPRQTLIFIVGTSAFLWTAIIWVGAHYL